MAVRVRYIYTMVVGTDSTYVVQHSYPDIDRAMHGQEKKIKDSLSCCSIPFCAKSQKLLEQGNPALFIKG